MTIYYDSSSNSVMLLTFRGTVWPRILPSCVIAVILFVLISQVASTNYQISLDFKRSFSFSMLTSVFVAIYVDLQYQRYMQNITAYFQLNKTVQHFAMLLVFFSDGNMDRATVEYRQRVLFVLNNFISSVMHTLVGRDDISCLSDDESTTFKPDPYESLKLLSQLINEQKCYLGRNNLDILKEIKLANEIGKISHLLKGLEDFNYTQMPFPIVNLCRVLIISYISMVPLWFADSSYSLTNPMCYFVVFFVVYSYLGMELVISDLDDPYGDDMTDLDVGSLFGRTEEVITAILTEDTGRFYDDQRRQSFHIETLDEPIPVGNSSLTQRFHENNEAFNQRLHIKLGRAQLILRNFDKAKYFFLGVIKDSNITSITLEATELLGDTLLLQKNIQQAIGYYKDALCIGLKYSCVSRRLCNKIGHGYFELHQLKKALIYYMSEEKLEANKKETNYSEDYKRMRFRKGLIYLHMNDYKNAFSTLYNLFRAKQHENTKGKSYKKYIEHQTRTSTEENGNYACLLLCLCFAHEGLGEYDRAISRLNDALMVQRRIFGSESIEALQTMTDLVRLYKKNADEEYAEEMSGRIDRIKRKQKVRQYQITSTCGWKNDYNRVSIPLLCEAPQMYVEQSAYFGSVGSR